MLTVALSDSTLDVGSGRFPQIAVAFPPSVTLPCQAVSCLAVLQNSRYAVIVIRRHGIVFVGFGTASASSSIFFLPTGKLRLQPGYPALVLVILLPVPGRIFQLADAIFFISSVFSFLQLAYLTLQQTDLLLVLFLFSSSSIDPGFHCPKG